MIKALIVGIFILSMPLFALAQTKTNEAIERQIKSLRGEKAITLSFDASGGTSKIMGVAENFSDAQAKQAGVLAMNFALGFFYPGTVLQKSPDKILFSIWVLSKKPRFADARGLTVAYDGGTIDLGSGRYTAKPRENLEYLNYEIMPQDLSAIAASSKATFRIGASEFTVTAEQMKLIKNFSRIADVFAAN